MVSRMKRRSAMARAWRVGDWGIGWFAGARGHHDVSV